MLETVELSTADAIVVSAILTLLLAIAIKIRSAITTVSWVVTVAVFVFVAVMGLGSEWFWGMTLLTGLLAAFSMSVWVYWGEQV